jgi:hypothetical protein
VNTYIAGQHNRIDSRLATIAFLEPMIDSGYVRTTRPPMVQDDAVRRAETKPANSKKETWQVAAQQWRDAGQDP